MEFLKFISDYGIASRTLEASPQPAAFGPTLTYCSVETRGSDMAGFRHLGLAHGYNSVLGCHGNAPVAMGTGLVAMEIYRLLRQLAKMAVT